MLNLHKLDIFLTVARAGSFSKAADQLYLSQPAVSQHIQDLEASLGTPLFERGPRGVSLTAAGEVLQDYAGRILRLVAEAETAIASTQNPAEGQLRIGATPGASVYMLPDWLQPFYRRFPDRVVSVITGTTPDLAARVLAHELDLAVVEGELAPDQQLRTLALREVEWLVLVGPGHRWLGQAEIDFAALDGERLVTRPANSRTRDWIDGLLRERLIAPVIVGEFDHPESIKRAVASGLGVAVLPECVVKDAYGNEPIRALHVKDVPLRRTLKLVWASDAPFTPLTIAFLHALADEFPQVRRLTLRAR